MKKQNNQPMTKLVLAALRQAAKKAVKRAVDTGTPLILWVNGEVREVDPRTVQIESKPRGRRKTGS
jgi:ABC-type sugar transport system substrate-binding protein